MRDVRVQLGDVVVAGDTLAVIHSRDLELNEIIARVLVKKARAVESRLSEMYRRGLVSANQFESVRFDTEVAHYRWLAASQSGKDRDHRAPKWPGGQGRCKGRRLGVVPHRGRAGHRPQGSSGTVVCA